MAAVKRLEALYGRLLDGLAAFSGVLLFLVMLVICADVLLRNVALVPGVHGVPAGSDLTEYGLYLMTMLAAPWLLRQGRHIRVDIVLRMIPKATAWYCEWVVDVVSFICCVVIAWYSAQAVLASHAAGNELIKMTTTPEWWSLVPIPVTFVLLSLEMLFRMYRLAHDVRGPRNDAVSSA